MRRALKLRKQIAELPQSSIVIKDSATSLSQLAAPDFWTTLDHQKLEFLRAEIKPLFRTVSEADFKAMRLERDVVEYSLAKLSDEDEKAETLKDGIVEQISELPLSIPFVQAEEPLIRASQANYFWSKTNALDLEEPPASSFLKVFSSDPATRSRACVNYLWIAAISKQSSPCPAVSSNPMLESAPPFCCSPKSTTQKKR